jgi:hypothetical protein
VGVGENVGAIATVPGTVTGVEPESAGRISVRRDERSAGRNASRSESSAGRSVEKNASGSESSAGRNASKSTNKSTNKSAERSVGKIQVASLELARRYGLGQIRFMLSAGSPPAAE